MYSWIYLSNYPLIYYIYIYILYLKFHYLLELKKKKRDGESVTNQRQNPNY